MTPACYRMLGLSVSYQGNSPSLFSAARTNVQNVCLKQQSRVMIVSGDSANSSLQGAALPVLQAGFNECSVPLLISPDLCSRELLVQTSGRLQTAFLALVLSCTAVAPGST